VRELTVVTNALNVGTELASPKHPSRPYRWRLPAGTLTKYIQHYNEHRPHRGLGLEAPVGHITVPSPLGNIARRNVLGGPIHEFHQLAASSEGQPVEAHGHRAKAEVMRQ
jgi:hypothetical protein